VVFSFFSGWLVRGWRTLLCMSDQIRHMGVCQSLFLSLEPVCSEDSSFLQINLQFCINHHQVLLRVRWEVYCCLFLDHERSQCMECCETTQLALLVKRAEYYHCKCVKCPLFGADMISVPPRLPSASIFDHHCEGEKDMGLIVWRMVYCIWY